MMLDPRGFSILLADGDERLAHLTARFLDAYGVQSKIVTTGWHVQSEVEHASFTCLVLALELPKMSGLEVCKAIRASHSQVPIILFGPVGSSNGVHALLAGADDFLRKPFSPRELLARIVTIVRRRRSSTA